MTWNFPFDPAGAKIDEEATLGNRVAGFLEKINEAFESTLPGAILKDIAEVGVGVVRDTAMVETLGGALELHKAFYGVKGLIHAEAEILHKVKTGGEILGILGGYFNYGLKKDAYPLMSAVLRGNFDTQLAKVTADDKANRIPVETTLALSSETADFPKYRLTVTRDAPVNPDHETYNGVLPWTQEAAQSQPNSGNLSIANPDLGSFSPYSLNQTDPTAYDSGKKAVEDLLELMKHSQVIRQSFARYGGIEGPLFGQIQDLAPSPACSTMLGSPMASTPQTICWQFDDGRA
jgi:hypothetical protein